MVKIYHGQMTMVEIDHGQMTMVNDVSLCKSDAFAATYLLLLPKIPIKPLVTRNSKKILNERERVIKRSFPFTQIEEKEIKLK